MAYVHKPFRAPRSSKPFDPKHTRPGSWVATAAGRVGQVWSDSSRPTGSKLSRYVWVVFDDRTSESIPARDLRPAVAPDLPLI